MKTIKLNQGQYLQEVEPFKSSGIPSNCILHKTVTGCGITTSEMKYTKRHSIIILPNVPVIEGKVKKHNEKCSPKEKVLGVYKGVEIDDILDYLKSDVTHKKILITPEGFNSKLTKCIENGHTYIAETFFLLYDECERIVKDVGYREQIAMPADWFFRFDNKAMVSATVLPFSDERFNDFVHYEIEPTFDFSKQTKLVETNNVLESLKRYLPGLNGERVALFLNSTDTIYTIIKALGIEKESKVYCADESVRKLKIEYGYRNACSKLEAKDMAKYNFFTSRFFSAVDIEVEYQPDVILITDLSLSQYSMLDPFTDVVQISGRYRNGISSLTHISNFDPSLVSRTGDNAKTYLQDCFATYDEFVSHYGRANKEGSKDTLKPAIQSSWVHRFYVGGKVNSFMVDNYIHEERVKGYYQNFENLLAAYRERPKHFVTNHSQEQYAVGDFEMLIRQKLKGRDLNEYIANKLHDIIPGGRHYATLGYEDEIAYINRNHPLVAKAYRLLGYHALVATGFYTSTIKEAVAKKELENKMQEMSKDVYKAVGAQRMLSAKDIPLILQPIYDKHGYRKPATQSDIRKFFETDRTMSKGEKVFKLMERLHKATDEQ